jgi:hypothetical protein
MPYKKLNLISIILLLLLLGKVNTAFAALITTGTSVDSRDIQMLFTHTTEAERMNNPCSATYENLIRDLRYQLGTGELQTGTTPVLHAHQRRYW